MIADSGGDYRNGSDDSHRNASQDLRRATSLLRLLKSNDGESLEDPQLQREFERLHDLLERIDRIASEVGAPEQTSEASTNAHPSSQPTAPVGHPEPGGQRATWSDPDTSPADSDASKTSGSSEQAPPEWANAQDEPSTRWWVHFNGDLSLDRLSQLRAHLDESPFTLDTRFDEITDGLIVLRIVTDERISMDHLDWILRQLMERVGLDRKSAIISKQ